MSLGLQPHRAAAQIGTGVVRHRRARPIEHAFEYRTYFLMLPMRSLRVQACRALSRNRFGWLSFHDRDHGDGRADALAWIDDLLLSEGIRDAHGEVWLHCYPRVLGYAFKPVSFWHCERTDGTLAAIVVEVNNTFGERHCYLLAGDELGYGRDLSARKVFHVSPFCRVQGEYVFRFMHASNRWVARIEHHDDPRGDHTDSTVDTDTNTDTDPVLVTSIGGIAEPLTRSGVRRAFLRSPLMTLAVTTRIHWHALRLWVKRVPWFSKPDNPPALTSR